MKLLKSVLYIILITALIFATTGCLNKASVSAPQAADAEEEMLTEEEGALADEALDVLTSEDKTDRLPGSLKWASVTLYAQGLDFFADQENGLYSIKETSKVSASSAKENAISTQEGEGTETEDSGKTGGSSTAVHQSSSGGVSTDLSVDGSMKVTESTTMDGQNSNIWWEMEGQ